MFCSEFSFDCFFDDGFTLVSFDSLIMFSYVFYRMSLLQSCQFDESNQLLLLNWDQS